MLMSTSLIVVFFTQQRRWKGFQPRKDSTISPWNTLKQPAMRKCKNWNLTVFALMYFYKTLKFISFFIIFIFLFHHIFLFVPFLFFLCLFIFTPFSFSSFFFFLFFLFFFYNCLFIYFWKKKSSLTSKTVLPRRA